MSGITRNERSRVGSALIAAGALLLALASVMIVGQPPASADHDNAPAGCFVVSEGASVTPADLSGPIVVNGVTVTFSNLSVTGGTVRQFDWSASGGTAAIEFNQNGQTRFSSGTGATGVGTGGGAMTHFFICGTPDQVEPPETIDVCLLDGDWGPETIDIDDFDADIHFLPGDEVDGGTLNESCEVVADTEETTTTTTTTTTQVSGTDEPTTTVAGPGDDVTTTVVLGPDDTTLPETGAGHILALLAGGLGLALMGSGSLVIAGERRRSIVL
jgi:hypothetical protein